MQIVCRICLNTDKKMYYFYSNRVLLYEQLTGKTFDSHDLLPKYVCWECEHYMSKYVAFKSKAVRSLRILTEILNREGAVHPTSCSQYQVKSDLSLTDILTDDVPMEAADTVILLEPFEAKIENENIKNNKNNLVNIKVDLSDDSDNDTKYSHQIFMPDNLSPSLPSNSTIKNECSVKENKKSPEKLSQVKSKGKKKVCQDNVDGVKKSAIKKSNNKTVARVRARKKNVPIGRRKKYDNVSDEIDKDVMNVEEFTLDEQIAEIQNRKESYHYKNAVYKCDKCFRGFSDSLTFERHTARHSDSCGDVECPLCKMRYTQYRLPRHMQSHMYRFSCKKCDFSTKTIDVAKKHENYHKGKQHACPHCPEVYSYKNSLLSHMRIKHPSGVSCQHCGLSFLNDKGLNMHVKWAHRDEPKTIPADGPHCARCDVTFATQEALDRHIQVSSKHADEREGPAVRNSISAKREYITTSAKRERNTVLTSEPYPDGPRTCEQCDEKLPNPSAYFFHFRAAHKDKNRTVFSDKYGERHMCEICGKFFQSANFLRQHKYVHSDTKEFECDRCGKRFQLEVNLKNHKRNHCGTRAAYPCSVCGKTFSNRSNRGRHMAIHKGFTYKCDLCDKVFNCRFNRKNHIDFVHNKKPWPKRNKGSRSRLEKLPDVKLQYPPEEADMEGEWTP